MKRKAILLIVLAALLISCSPVRVRMFPRIGYIRPTSPQLVDLLRREPPQPHVAFAEIVYKPSPSVMMTAPILGLLFNTALTTFGVQATAVEAPARESRKAGIIIPNIDADSRAGVPDPEDVFQVRVDPGLALSADALVRVEVVKPWTRFARVYICDPSRKSYRLIKGPTAVKPDESRGNGVVIGIEATHFADSGRPPAIDAKVIIETGDGRPLHEESFSLAVAPFLVSCCLDPADRVQVVKTKVSERFVSDLASLVEAAGAELSVIEDPSLPEYDLWIQDAVEIGTATDGTRLVHVALHGNRGRELDDLFAKRFLAKDFGVIREGEFRGKSAEWIDWFGNLEVSPPVTVNGKEFHHGRVYAGTQGERAMHPDVIKFLEAQGAQAPVLWLDTSWLVIGHVDEMVSWVPSKVGIAYRMLIPSAKLAVEILNKAEKDAPGSVLNRGRRREGDKPGEFERPVAGVLNDKVLMAAQEFVQKKIDAVRRTLQDGLGVADEDIIEIPVLFNSSPEWHPGRYFSETTNMVNSLLVGSDLIVPNPFGPIVDGKDVLLQAVKDRLEPLGCRVLAVDDFYPYHRWGGEVDCGTNATRRPRG